MTVADCLQEVVQVLTSSGFSRSDAARDASAIGREFLGRPFTVTPAVLIPRPETEVVIEAALEHGGPLRSGHAAVRVLDVGTGSGCLAITLASEWPSARVIATDTSRAAL